MWIGACTSTIGTYMQIVAQSWLIYTLSNSSWLLALDQVMGGLPIMLFSLVGGVRVRRGGTAERPLRHDRSGRTARPGQ